MADGEITTVCAECGTHGHAIEACPVREMLARDRAFAAERERRRREDQRATPDFSDALARTIAAAADAWTATPEALAAYHAAKARDMWTENLEASGIHASTRDEDRERLLAGKLEPIAALRATQMWLVNAQPRCACPGHEERRATRCELADCAGRRDPGRNVLALCGPTGLGKTLAAAWAITREGGLYVKVDELIRDYARWERDRTAMDATSNVWRRYQRSHLVVLDEVGRERDADLARDAFYKLVDERQSRRKQLTIIITNLSKTDFQTRLKGGAYDARTYSRLARDAWVVDLSGRDRREQAADWSGA